MISARTRTLIIEVTETHIARGRQCDCIACPVALALRDAIHAASLGASVYANALQMDYRLSSDFVLMSAKTPPEVVAFIQNFDEGRDVKPFTFTATFEDREPYQE